jgi:hypothetical protein
MDMPRWPWALAAAVVAAVILFSILHPNTNRFTPETAQKPKKAKSQGAARTASRAASQAAPPAKAKAIIASAKADLLALEPAALRTSQRRTQLPPYVPLTLKWSASVQQAADRILTSGWEEGRQAPFAIQPPVDWTHLMRENASWNCSLHAWAMLDQLLFAFDKTGDSKYFTASLAFAADWVRTQPRASDTTGGNTEKQSPCAWNDMTASLRTYRLAYLLDAACRRDDVPDALLQDLWRSLVGHLAWLESRHPLPAAGDRKFLRAIAQFSASTRFSRMSPLDEVMHEVSAQLPGLIETQFSKEGVHLEHSPGYQRLLTQAIETLASTAALSNAMPPPDRLRQFEDALAWMIQPDGRLANLGDSTRYEMEEQVPSDDLCRSTLLQFAISAGRVGQPPQERVKGFPESGLLVMRSGWPSDAVAYRRSSYLAQQCAFHSQAHKHSDDLSFVWYDHETDILVDAGRFSSLDDDAFDRQTPVDPARKYVESARAHNTVEIDDVAQDRVDRKPYGSALLRWGESDGVQFAESHVRDPQGIRHARVLLNRPHEWLIVFDWLWDNNGAAHQYRQWFQLAPGFAVSQQGNTLRAQSDRTGLSLLATPLLDGPALVPPVKGQQQPSLQGWWSPDDGVLQPIWSACWARQHVPSALFATLFTFADDVKVDAAASKVNASGRSGVFRWHERGRGFIVRFERPERGDFHLTCEVHHPPTTQTQPR